MSARMGAKAAFWRRAQRILVALALVAMGVRAVVAPGTMLSAAPDHTLAITLCGGGSALLDLDTGEARDPGSPSHDGRHSVHAPCLFAAAAAVAPPPIAATLDTPRHVQRVATQAFAAARVGAGLAAPPPPSTGPPAQLI